MRKIFPKILKRQQGLKTSGKSISFFMLATQNKLKHYY